MDNPILEAGFETGRVVSLSSIYERLRDLEDKWFEAPWGLQPWEQDSAGKRLITGQMVTEDEVLYVRLSDVYDILRKVNSEQD